MKFRGFVSYQTLKLLLNIVSILFKVIGRGHLIKSDYITTACSGGQKYNWIPKGNFTEDTLLTIKNNVLNAT